MVHKSHELKIGFEARLNRDTTIFGLANNGAYDFGNGTVYAAAPIRYSSGTHDIQAGDPLPDTLSAFLTGTPYSFTATVGGLNFPQGDRIGESAVRRDAYNLWLADHWKIGPHFVLDYTLRYEVNTPISEGHVLGGIGMEALIANPGHSTFNAGTASVEKSSSRLGLGFQISYTFSESLDNSSSMIGGAAGATSGPGAAGAAAGSAPAQFGQSAVHVRPYSRLHGQLHPEPSLRSRSRTSCLGTSGLGLATPQYHHACERLAVHSVLRNPAVGPRSRTGGST